MAQKVKEKGLPQQQQNPRKKLLQHKNQGQKLLTTKQREKITKKSRGKRKKYHKK